MEILKCDKWEKKTLIGIIGLPYSGKSTTAKHLSIEHTAPIVCPDTIRIALHGHKFIPAAEGIVWAVAKLMVHALFLAGHDFVILDATNTTRDRRKEWESKKYKTDWRYINTSVDVCKHRAIENNDMVILPIIESMAEKLEVEEFNDPA